MPYDRGGRAGGDRSAAAASDALPSWNDGPAKQAIMSFVKDVTDKSSLKFVQPPDRIAVFDQDGTLWVEHPLYAQAMFALDRVRQLAGEHPQWESQEPFKSIIAGDRGVLAALSEHDWMRIVAVTHTGMSTEDFQRIVGQWLTTARHPRFKRPYTELVYQPMREVIDYLRANGFKTYIVTGGGQELSRLTASTLRNPAGAGDRIEYCHKIPVQGRAAGLDAQAEGLFRRRSHR